MIYDFCKIPDIINHKSDFINHKLSKTMNKQELFENIKKKQSFLCVGLDTDIKKIPEHLLKEEDPIFAFNKAIIDATAP